MPFIQQASNAAGKVDAVFFFILILAVLFFIGITFVILFFVFKYSKKRHPKGEDIEGNVWLETVWTATPIILFLLMFYFGWTNFEYMRNVPRDAMEITVNSRQWAWSFVYPNGKQTTELILALNKPVKLELRSQDVIHGFFIPAFRIKEDVVPGKNNYTWFTPTQLGTFDIQCTVICGVDHANMLAKAVVVPVSDFGAWYFGGAEAPLPNRPQVAVPATDKAASPAMTILNRKECLTCHSLDGSVMVGPTFKGLYGRKEILIAGDKEQEIEADEARLIQAIQNPTAARIKGYPPAMPANPLTNDELKQVIEFLKNLK